MIINYAIEVHSETFQTFSVIIVKCSKVHKQNNSSFLRHGIQSDRVTTVEAKSSIQIIWKNPQMIRM